jgi:hypothetical protein
LVSPFWTRAISFCDSVLIQTAFVPDAINSLRSIGDPSEAEAPGLGLPDILTKNVGGGSGISSPSFEGGMLDPLKSILGGSTENKTGAGILSLPGGVSIFPIQQI